MSVEFRYIPQTRIGNVLFQYACARIFADVQGLRLLTPFDPPNGPGIVRVIPSTKGAVVHEPVVHLTDSEWIVRHKPGTSFRFLGMEEELLCGTWPQAHYVLEGWFQRSSWYHERRDSIERFMIPEPVKTLNTRDIVLNLRIGADWKSLKWVIHPRWYLDILAQERFDTLHIVTDEIDEEYLSHFSGYSPNVISSGPNGDWEYLRSFDRIVCSNSSFAWWACFFSKASRIYTFKRWNSDPIVRIGPFPNGIETDGPFLHELAD